MCYYIHKYDCGHTSRKHKTDCGHRGDVSHYFKKYVLKVDPYCKQVIEKRKRRLCRACASHGEENEDVTSRGRERVRHERFRHDRDHDRGRRHKDHDRKERGEDRDRHKRRKEKDGDRERRHRQQGHRTKEREKGRRPLDETVDDYSNMETTHETIPVGMKTPPVPQENPKYTGFSDRDWPDGYGAPRPAKHTSMMAWVEGLGIEGPEDAQPWSPGPKPPEPLSSIVGEPNKYHSYRSANLDQKREQTPEPVSPEPDSPESATPRPLSPEPVSPLIPDSPPKQAEEYIPARAEWRDFPSAPAMAYQPDIPARPPSSVYPCSKVGGFLPPEAYSSANQSDFFTVYAESELPTSNKKSLENQRGKKSSETQRGKSSKSFERARAKWPAPAFDENSRYANMAGTTSEFMAQQETRARREMLAKVKEDEETAELREEQEAWQRAVNAVKAEEAEKEKRREQEAEREQQRHQASKTSSSSNWSSGRSRAPRPSTRTSRTTEQAQYVGENTYATDADWSSNPYDEYPHPGINRTQSSTDKPVEKIWNPLLQVWVSIPTESSTGSQQFQHPRSAPRPPSVPSHPSQNSAGNGLERRHSVACETTVSLFHPRQQEVHTVNPAIVEKNWGKTSGRSSGKKSKTASASSTPKESSRPSFASIGRLSDFRKKFSRQPESEASFKCADAAAHDRMHAQRPGSSKHKS